MTSLKVSLVKLTCLSFMLLCYVTVFKTSADSSFIDQNDPSPLVEELRSKIGSLELRSSLVTDKMLARYIEDSRYRINRAERQLQRTARWRKAANVDNLLSWTPPEVLSSNLPYECTGSTEEGNPIFYIPLGQWNFTRIQEAGQGPEVYNYGVRLLEDISNSTRDRISPNGERVDQAVVVLDASGYGLRSLINFRATSAIIRLARDIDRHYPFTVKKWYVVRSSVSFRAVAAAVGRALSRNRRESFEFLSSFSLLGRGARVLSHNIPANALPVELGGKYVLRYKAIEQQQQQQQQPQIGLVFSSINNKSISNNNNNNNAIVNSNESVVLDSINNINSNFNSNTIPNDNNGNFGNVVNSNTPANNNNNIQNDSTFDTTVSSNVANTNNNDNNVISNNIRNDNNNNNFSNNVNTILSTNNNIPANYNSASISNNNNFNQASPGGYSYYPSSSNNNYQYQQYRS